MRGNIDHLEQPEEYHKMAVPGKLKFLWNIKLKFLNENTTIRLPGNTLTPTLSEVVIKNLCPHPVISSQRIPLPPPCQQLPANTFTPTPSAVASEYLYLHPVSSCQPITLPPTCQQLAANTFTPTLSAVAREYLYPHPVSSLPFFSSILANSRKTLHESSKISVASLLGCSSSQSSQSSQSLVTPVISVITFHFCLLFPFLYYYRRNFCNLIT